MLDKSHDVSPEHLILDEFVIYVPLTHESAPSHRGKDALSEIIKVSK